jgi:[ribosomal protein S5]-alanine N-acetyltransferase
MIETSRLVLRSMAEDDAHHVWRLNSDPDARDILHRLIFPHYAVSGMGRLAVVQKSNKEFLGWWGLKHRPDVDEVDLGYRLSPVHWGQGFATEAAAAVS